MTRPRVGTSLLVLAVGLLAASQSLPALLTNAGHLPYLRGTLRDSAAGTRTAATVPSAAPDGRAFEKALTLDPDYRPAHRGLARVHAANGEWPKARAEYARLPRWEIQRLLSARWLSLAVRGSGNDEAQARFDDLATLLLAWIDLNGDTTGRVTAWRMRSEQWLHRHGAALAAGERWLRDHHRADPAERAIVECLTLESRSRLSGTAPDAQAVRACGIAFDGTRHEMVTEPGDGIMTFYPVAPQAGTGAVPVLGVAVHQVDRDLGFPVAVHFYWKASGEGPTQVTAARVANLAPNPGFEFERCLQLPASTLLPVGFRHDIYGAPPSTRRLVGENQGANVFLRLDNAALATGRSSGLTSYEVAVSPDTVYIQGGRLRSQGGGLHLGRNWTTKPPREVFSHVAGNIADGDWVTMAAIVRPPEDAVAASVWLLDYRKPGTADFDDLIFLPVPRALAASWRLQP